MQVLSDEHSFIEIDRWLEHKRVKRSKIKKYDEMRGILADAISEGDLVLNDDFTLTHKLSFPITSGEKDIAEIVYKPRITIGEANGRLKNAGESGDSRILAYAGVLSALPTAVLEKLDSSDASIMTAIVVFFL